MTCPTTLDELFATDPTDITFNGDIYAINVELKLPPWLPPCVEVWQGEKPDHTEQDRWDRVATLLQQLYAEHKRRHDR